MIPRPAFGEVLKSAVLIRLTARILSLTLALVLLFVRDYFWAVGSLLAGAVLEINLTLFIRFVSRSRPGRLDVPLWVTLIKFYAICFATMVFCFFVIKFQLGDPLAFILGLGVFIPSLVVGLCWYAFTRKPQAPLSPDWGYTKPSNSAAGQDGQSSEAPSQSELNDNRSDSQPQGDAS
jgi:hypothetical protein